MKLRSMAVAAALGATVLTTVPAVTVPFAAHASCVDDHSTCGNDDPPNDQDLPDPVIITVPGSPGGPGGGGDGGGDGGGGQGPVSGSLPTVITNGTNISRLPETAVEIGQPYLELTGSAEPAPTPEDPGFSGSDGSGGGGGSDSAVLISFGKLWEKNENCYRNGNSMPYKATEKVDYEVNYQVSANISAKAFEVLTATIGTQLNTKIVRSQSVEINLGPGESWTLAVQYQTNAYRITTFDYWSLSYKTEFVNITSPTGVVTARPC
ncbi:DUF6426 family protein [Kitasatospora sp. NPDC096147]|uniref:DUF6426 family protein n=1 Tax=Kitasatospora sp. NPDC096147 TaxID=3364093 RepID=UPI003810F676